MRAGFFLSWLFSICFGISTGFLFHSIWLGVFLGIWALLSLIFFGVYNIRSGFFIKTWNRLEPGRNNIVLSFDDGPDPLTPEVLGILQKHGVKAMFFLIGHKIEGRRELVQKIHHEGHVIGNHTFSHTGRFYFWTASKMLEDINRTTLLIESITGERVRYFRPPFGVTNPPLAKALSKTRLDTIGWSFRSFDTVRPLDARMEKRVMREVKKGDILLFHDTSQGMAEFLDRMIPKLKEKGFKFVLL